MTFDGTEGTNAQVFAPSCVSCHNGAQPPDLRTSAGASGSIATIIDRINRPAGDGLLMPEGGPPLSSTLRALIDQWNTDGLKQNDVPSVTTGGATPSKNSAVVFAAVNDNGAEAGYQFLGSFGSAVTASDDNFNSGGGTDTDTASATISSLSCETTYDYQVRGTNVQGTANGSSRSFTTTACNKVPTINAIGTQSATEDQPFSLNVSVTDTDGGLSDSVSYSISSAPAVVPNLSINNSGLITWTPVSETLTSISVTVQVDDANADPGFTTDTENFTINITLIDEIPAILTMPNESVSIPEDTLFSFDYDVDDPEGATLVFSVSTVPDITAAPPLMAIDSNGVLTWTPDGTVPSVDVTVTVSDGNPDNNQTDTFSASVIASNDAPVFAAVVNQAIDEEQTLVYDVDATDIDMGAVLVFSLVSPPVGMTIDPASGVITWTPDEVPPGAPTVETITVAVTDNIILEPVTISFDVTVTPVNDEPVFMVLGPVSVTELDTLTVDAGPNLSDPDDNNDGTGQISWSLVNEPDGMSISGLGVVSWIPGEESEGTYAVTVQVQDGLENGSLVQSQLLDVTVNILDTDEDTLADYNDNCPNDANTDQANLDEDEFGDVCDDDDDGDGIFDTAEIANGLDPRNAADGPLDLDGDGLSNLDEFNTCLLNDDELCDAIQTDSVAPTITVSDMVVNATGYVTDVVIPATALDGNDGEVAVSSDRVGPFRPGRYTITYTSADSTGNVATLERTLDVRPQASLAGTTVTGEGQTISVPVRLNGNAPSYPVTLNYTVSGPTDSADYDLAADGAITIGSGTTADLVINISDDGIAEGSETFSISLTTASDNVGLIDSTTHDVMIVEDNAAPSVSLAVVQAGVDSLQVYKDQGIVTITANGNDPNGDMLSFDWIETDSELGGTASGNQFVFDASQVLLAPGAYTVSVQVSDGTSQVSDSTTLVLGDAAPMLDSADDSDNDDIDDLAEGRGDLDRDGLPDFQDPVDDPTLLNARVLPAGNNFERLIRANTGVSLALGNFAQAAQRGGARIVAGDVTDAGGQPVTNDGFTIIGGLYDYQVRGLTTVRPGATVVIPLTQSIANDASLHKFANDVWAPFVSGGTDNFRSAPSVNNECPAPGDTAYQSGLVPFFDCLELTLTDGGPNDSDGAANGVIRDPVAVVTATPLPGSVNDNTPLPPPPERPTGGGVLGWLSLLFLSLLVLRRLHFVRRVER